jgi:hypothetical protein
MEIITQLIGGLGILASCAAFQCKKHKHILNLRTLSEFIFAVQYLLLGAYTGMAADLLGCLRNQIFTRQIAAGKKTNGSIAVFSLAFALFGILTWEGWYSIFSVIGSTAGTFFLWTRDPKKLRLGSLFVVSPGWMTYNICVLSIAGIVTEALSMGSIIISFIRFKGFAEPGDAAQS